MLFRSADIHSQIGKIFEANGLYTQALTHYSRAYTIYSYCLQSDKESLTGYIWTLYDIGNIFFRQNQYENAIEIYTKTSLLFYQKSDYYGIASSFSNIGLCYNQWNKNDSALKYFEKALEIRQQLNDPGPISHSFRQIGDLYLLQNRFPQALVAYKKAAEIDVAHNLNRGLIITYLNIGSTYISMNKLDSAGYYLNKARLLGEKGNEKEYLVHVHIEFSKLSALMGDKGLAEKYIKNAVSLAEQTGIIPLKSMAYSKYHVFAYQNNDYKTALENLIKYNEQEELMRNQKTEAKLKQMEFLIMSEELQAKIKSIEKENYINLLKNKNKSNILYYFIISSFILLLFALGNIRKMNFKFNLIGDLISDYSILQFIIVSIIAFLYFTFFISFFTPFGLEEFNEKPGVFIYLVSGFIFTVNLMIWIYLFSYLEKKISAPFYQKHRFLALSLCIIISTTTSLFVFYTIKTTLYTSDYLYFSLFMFTFIAYVLPVYGIIIIAEKFLLKKHVAQARKLSEHFKNKIQQPSSGKITLQSILTKEDLTIDVSLLLYIEAQGNYCKVYQLEGKTPKMKMIHLTMKLAEEQCSSASNLLRCHKSFIVNTDYIIRVTGNSRGYQLCLEHTDVKIPLSKHYCSDTFLKDKF